MSKKEIISAIERTIEEAREYQRQNPNDDFAIIAKDEYRRNLETTLDFYDLTHPSPLRAIATSIISPIGFVLSPIILVGGLAYLAGREIYRKIK